MTVANTRSNPAPVKVICLGLGRTGTCSLRDALATLGFGPSYKMATVIEEGGKDLAAWCKIGDGNGTPEDFDGILRGYGSVLDYPAAMYPAELYAAYPDAKFILTTRDPAKWERSMRVTLLAVYRALRAKRTKSPEEEAVSSWAETYLKKKYHRGRLDTNAQQELLDHNARVERVIPADKLLVYEVGEGWERLARFLDVPAPRAPFPHVNDTAQFQARWMQMVEQQSQSQGQGGNGNASGEREKERERVGVEVV